MKKRHTTGGLAQRRQILKVQNQLNGLLRNYFSIKVNIFL